MLQLKPRRSGVAGLRHRSCAIVTLLPLHAPVWQLCAQRHRRHRHPKAESRLPSSALPPPGALPAGRAWGTRRPHDL